MSLLPRGMSSLLHRSSHTAFGLRHLPASLLCITCPAPQALDSETLAANTQHAYASPCLLGTHQTKDTSQPPLPPRHVLLLSLEILLLVLHSSRFRCHTVMEPPSIAPLIAPQALQSAVYLSPLQTMGFPSTERVFDLRLPSAQRDVCPSGYVTLISIYSVLFLFPSFSLQAGKLRIRKDMSQTRKRTERTCSLVTMNSHSLVF